MAVPVNITPALAIDITDLLPYDVTFTDLDLIPDADPSYTPSCSSSLLHPLWFKIRGSASLNALGIQIEAVTVPSDYLPVLSVWQGTPPVLTQVNDELCLASGTIDNTILSQIGLTEDEYQYLLITDDGGTPDPGSDARVQFDSAPAATVPAGTLVVSNDSSGFPTVFIDRITGAVSWVKGWPAFEMAELLPDGILAITAERIEDDAADRIEIYSDQLELLYTITGSPFPSLFNAISPISSNRTDRFYLLLNSSPASSIIYSFGTDGVLDATSWDITSGLAVGADTPSGLAISDDEEVAYYLYKTFSGSRGLRIGRWDLINDIALSQLIVPNVPNETVGRDLLLIDGFLYATLKGAGGNTDNYVRKYDVSTGVLTDFYGPFTSAATSPRLTRDSTNGQIVMMYWPDGASEGDSAYFITIQLSDMTAVGSPVTTELKLPSETGDPQYGPSQSCPIIVLLNEVTPAVIPNPLSGLYKLSPLKRSDTVYLEFDPVRTQVVKIP